MSTAPVSFGQPEVQWQLPDRGRVAMLALIAAEAAIFTIFVVAYVFYVGKSLSGPRPKAVLELPILSSVLLLSSSWTMHLAVKQLGKGSVRSFTMLWFVTICFGSMFLYGTASEWHRLIYREGLTISTNLFGTTYYSLVGLHAFHVVVGLVCLLAVMTFAVLGSVGQEHTGRVDVLSLYWHFVDAAWVVVFTVVYVIGR